MNTEVFSQDSNGNVYVTITLEEYKELLITKGKYEELKSQTNRIPKTNITYRYDGKEYKWPPEEERKVTC